MKIIYKDEKRESLKGYILGFHDFVKHFHVQVVEEKDLRRSVILRKGRFVYPCFDKCIEKPSDFLSSHSKYKKNIFHV